MATAAGSVNVKSAPQALLTVKDVCAVLGVSRPTLYKILHSGELESVRVGRGRRFTPAQVEDYVRRHKERW